MNIAVKRIRKDMLEYYACRGDFPYIAAAPLCEDNIFVWHINVKAPDGPYAQHAVHLELTFPDRYPIAPPKIRCFTPIQHPNVFDDFICLDLLKAHTSNTPYEGWSAGYTLTTVLLQLQSFLFSENIPQEDGWDMRLDKTQSSVVLSMRTLRRFRCHCGHHHENPNPAFPAPKNPQSSHKFSHGPNINCTGLAAQNESSSWRQVMCESFKCKKGKAIYELYIDWIGGKWTRDNFCGGLARVGWGKKYSRRLGEDRYSFGYGGTAKFSYNRTFDDFGIPFAEKATITTCVDFDRQRVGFAVNGKFQRPWMRLPISGTLFPIVLFKNGRVVFNFDKPKYDVFGGKKADMYIVPMEETAARNTWSEHLPETAFLDISEFLTLEELTKCFYVCKDWQQFITKYSLCSAREVQCFVTKQSSAEAVLGLCFEVKTDRRGNISGVGSIANFISQNMWQSGHRRTLWGTQATDFLVLPINQKHIDQVSLQPRLIETYLRIFKGKYRIRTTFPNTILPGDCSIPAICTLMNTCVLSMALGENVVSDQYIMCYAQLHHLLVLLAAKDPKWVDLANENLRKFINGPRNKSVFGDLGHFLPLLLLVTDEFDWDAFIQVFTQELFARNVGWYVMNRVVRIPKMKDERLRLQAVFDETKVSRAIVMFQISFFNLIRSEKNTLSDLNGR